MPNNTIISSSFSVSQNSFLGEIDHIHIYPNKVRNTYISSGSRPRSINTRVLTNVPPYIITTTNAIMWASNPFDLALLDISLLFIGAKVYRFCL